MHYFREAIECDPTYALAYAGLAEAYIPQGFYCHVPPPKRFRVRGPRRARARDRCEPLRGQNGHRVDKGGATNTTSTAAEHESRAAIEGSPNYPRAHQTLTETLSVRGAFLDEARRRDQAGSRTGSARAVYERRGRMAYYFARRFEAAIAQAQAASTWTGLLPAHLFLGWPISRLGACPTRLRPLERASTCLNGAR